MRPLYYTGETVYLTPTLYRGLAPVGLINYKCNKPLVATVIPIRLLYRGNPAIIQGDPHIIQGQGYFDPYIIQGYDRSLNYTGTTHAKNGASEAHH